MIRARSGMFRDLPRKHTTSFLVTVAFMGETLSMVETANAAFDVSDPDSPDGSTGSNAYDHTVAYIGPETPLINSLQILLRMPENLVKRQLLAQWVAGSGIFHNKREEARAIMGDNPEKMMQKDQHEEENDEITPETVAILEAKLEYLKGLTGTSNDPRRPRITPSSARKYKFDLIYSVDQSWDKPLDKAVKRVFTQPNKMPWTQCLRTEIPELKLVDSSYFELDWSSVPIDLIEWTNKPGALGGLDMGVQIRIQALCERGKMFLKQISEDVGESSQEHDAQVLKKLVDSMDRLLQYVDDLQTESRRNALPITLQLRVIKLKTRMSTWMEIFTNAEGGLSAYPLQDFLAPSADSPALFSNEYQAARYRFLTTFERVFYEPSLSPTILFPVSSTDIREPHIAWPFKPTFYTSPRTALPKPAASPFNISADINNAVSPAFLNEARLRVIIHSLALQNMLASWRAQKPRANIPLFATSPADLASLRGFGREIWLHKSRTHAIFKAAALVLWNLDVVWTEIVMVEGRGGMKGEAKEGLRARMMEAWGRVAAQTCVDVWGAAWVAGNEMEVVMEADGEESGPEGLALSGEESSSDGLEEQLGGWES